jgi:uncharacterized protein YbbK (DUF523 family)
MDYILTEKIKLGISACNFGAKVRYNHRGWDRLACLDRQKLDYTWTPICPEVNSGLGVPRPPMKLTSGNGHDFWEGKAKVKNRKGQNITEAVLKGVGNSLNILKQCDLEGYVFMEGSPTCGVYRTTLKNKRLGKPPGVWGSVLLKEDLFLIPAIDLESPWKWWDWSRRLHAFVWLRRQELANMNKLYDVWHNLKFICQEVDVAAAREIGQSLANTPKKKVTRAFIAAWKQDVLRLIRRPSQLNRIYATMLKHYAHYRKYFGLKPKDLSVPDIRAGKHKFIEELGKLERKALAEGYQFKGRPIAYQPDNRF